MLEHFINKEHISKGFELLKKQIRQRTPSHLRMEYCIHWEEGKVFQLNADEFYNNYVQDDKFYNLENIFYCNNYLGLKCLYGERPFQFLSFEMGVLYYAVTIFIKESMTPNRIEAKKSLNDVGGFTYYGCVLDDDKPYNSEILYTKDYKRYLSQKSVLINSDPSFVNYVISTDIKSYFYSIDHDVLLNIIKERAENIDDEIVNALKKFLNHLMNGGKGIPVTENNIASSYLSSIYFAPFEEHLIKNVLNDANTSYIRYVDDFYIIINDEVSIANSKIREKLNNIENEIIDFLYSKLKLVVSGSKSKRDKYEVSQDDEFSTDLIDEDIESMIDELLHSDEYEEIIDDYIDRQLIEEKNEKFQKCLSIIENIKKQTNSFKKISIDKVDSNYLNKIIIPKELLEYSQEEEVIKEVEKRNIFSDTLTLEFILAKHKVFLHLVSLNPKLRECFHQWLLKQCSTNNSLNQKVFAIFEFYSKLLFLERSLKLDAEEMNSYKSAYQIVLRKLIKENPTNTHVRLVGRSLGV